jgi:hypothetical protein
VFVHTRKAVGARLGVPSEHVERGTRRDRSRSYGWSLNGPHHADPTLNSYATAEFDPDGTNATFSVGRPQHWQCGREPIAAGRGLASGDPVDTRKVRNEQ